MAFSIASFVIAGENWNANCDGDMMPLPVWLVVSAAVSLVYVIVRSAMTLGFVILFSIEKILSLIVSIPYIIISLTYSLFIVAWVIVGGVALFRDGSDCKDEVSSLWIMSLVMFIVGCLQICSIFALDHQEKKSKMLSKKMFKKLILGLIYTIV